MKKRQKPVTDGGFKMFKKTVRKQVKKEHGALAFSAKAKAKRAAKKRFKKDYEEGSWQ